MDIIKNLPNELKEEIILYLPVKYIKTLNKSIYHNDYFWYKKAVKDFNINLNDNVLKGINLYFNIIKCLKPLTGNEIITMINKHPLTFYKHKNNILESLNFNGKVNVYSYSIYKVGNQEILELYEHIRWGTPFNACRYLDKSIADNLDLDLSNYRSILLIIRRCDLNLVKNFLLFKLDKYYHLYVNNPNNLTIIFNTYIYLISNMNSFDNYQQKYYHSMTIQLNDNIDDKLSFIKKQIDVYYKDLKIKISELSL